MRKYISIRTKLVTAVGLCCAVIISGLIAYTSIGMRSDVIENAKRDIVTVAHDVSDCIALDAEKSLGVGRTFAHIIAGVRASEASLDIGRDPARVMLKNLLENNESLVCVYMVWEPNAFDELDVAYAGLEPYDETGRFRCCWQRQDGVPVEAMTFVPGEHKIVEQLYERCETTRREVVGDPQRDSHGEWVIPLGIPIMREGLFCGIIGIEVSQNGIQDIVSRSSESRENLQACVLAHDGVIIASNDPLLVGEHMSRVHADWSQDIQYVQSAMDVMESDEGRYAAFSPVRIGNTASPWSVNINMPHEVIVGHAMTHTWLTVGIGAGLTVLCLLLVYILVNRLIQPLMGLTRLAGEVAEGNLDGTRVEASRDEIGDVVRSFDQVVQSFREIGNVCEAISKGDYSKRVQERGDKDVLGASVNTMAETLRDVVDQANAIAKGDYSHDIVPRSQADELGIALSNMTRQLRVTTDANRRESWLKTGLGELNERMQGEQSTAELARNVITQVGGYTGALIGAIYLTNVDGKLQMAGSYAYTHYKEACTDFEFGQGLVGQAALEKRTIVATELPPDYLPVQSGTGKGTPSNVIVIPYTFEGKVIGVIELGAFHPFDDAKIEFLESAAESIAIAVESAQSRMRTEELLLETQRQSEELEIQQQKLKANNEQLEEQAEILTCNEKILKSQQEDLEHANAELEEKTATLEEQKHQIEQSWQEIKARTLELEAANRYKSEFLSNISHELRTPLNSLLILARMLMENEQGNLTPDQVESAKVIHEGGTDLLSLINEILDLSKIEAGRMDLLIEDTHPMQIAGDIERNFRHVAEDRGLIFTVDCEGEAAGVIQTDARRVKQVLKNFLSNAFKFTSDGHVSVRIFRPDSSVCFKTAGLHASGVIGFSVSDTGIGIARDKQEIVMEAFRQADGSTNRIYGGTGLGLTISAKLAGMLGGEIAIDSELGKGSTFTLYLPCNADVQCNETAPSEAPVKEKAVEDSIDESFEGAPVTNVVESVFESDTDDAGADDDRKDIGPGDHVILIIEDDVRFARILTDMAHKKDFKCLVAGEGRKGLDLAYRYTPTAIILDIGLPDMDGMKVLDALKENGRTRHIPVHFMSARDESEVSVSVMRKGAIGYLPKPASREHIDEALSQINQFVEKDVRRLLLVESSEDMRQDVVDLIASGDIEIKTATTGAQACELLSRESFDCVVLDPMLEDMSGHELLERMQKDGQANRPPVIVYTGTDTLPAEHAKLEEYAGAAVLKEVESPERLLDETALFLHRVETSLPPEQQRVIRMMHDKDSILNGKKVLIADDDMRNVFALTHALKSRGVIVVRAENGADAMAKLVEHTDIDIVLMDIMMPVMDGYEAMREIRKQERFWKLPILALTAKAMRGDRQKCIEAGANDYVAKPIDIERVLSMLRVWLYL